jgi:hypothetical protein
MSEYLSGRTSEAVALGIVGKRAGQELGAAASGIAFDRFPAILNQSRSWRRGRICHTCSVRTFVDFAIVLWSPSLDFFTASCLPVPGSVLIVRC